ncbi:MAG: IS630 family transposase [Nostoc sp.]
MKNFLLEQQQKSERIAILTEFIHSHPEARELKRAIAVKMALQDEPYSKITKLLGMHKSCITNWKQRFEAEGLDGIKLGYKGAKSYLTTEQHTGIITWLRVKEYCDIDELVSYLDENYGVIYQSKQSYYALLSSAKISWNKSQKTNPNFNLDLVKIKREEIINFLSQNQAQIESGHLVVFFVDECHLLANDVCGYVWGKTDIRIEIPIKNIKDKQTYFGALDYKTQEFIVREYPAGNSSNTVDFIKYLQNQRSGKRIALIWDGASYHRSDEVKKFLLGVNDRHEPAQWPITCIRFAPNAPEQNPVEDVWLQSKNFLRKYWHLCKSFSVVKWLFKFFTNHQEFDFPKLHQYEPCSDLK